MVHRHLENSVDHDEFSIAAIDDVIARGKRSDWVELREEFLARPSELGAKILAACKGHADDPHEQRFRLWQRYAERQSN